MVISNMSSHNTALTAFVERYNEIIKNTTSNKLEWIAEIIKNDDTFSRTVFRLDEYFSSGVNVVWHIFPENETVYVYTAADEVQICRGEKICSGAPAVVDFEITAKDIFRKD
jgi:hypothetical protein